MHTVSLVISNELGFLGSVNCASLKYYKIIADCQSQQQVEEYWKEINDFLDKVTQHKSVFARKNFSCVALQAFFKCTPPGLMQAFSQRVHNVFHDYPSLAPDNY